MSELRRRNVFRVAIAYLAAAWLLTEVAGTLFPAFGVPDWGVRFIVIVFVLGFVPALVFSWVYELTPDGLKLERDVVRDKSITHLTAKRLDTITIALIAVALVFVVADRLWLREAPPPADAPDSNSIAVLPFVNMSDDPGNEYFSDGISEEILNVLSRVEGLNVASRTSSFSFKGEGRSLNEIARALNVSHVVEGSVRKSDGKVRITAQLIEARGDRHLWAQTYDRDLVDIFAIQSEIANAIVSSLEGSLRIEGSEEIPIAVATTNMSAYDVYLEARELFVARSDLHRSITLFEQAVDLDSGFARAWEGLSAAYSVMPSWGFAEREYFDLSLEAARKAIEIDSSLSLAYGVIGWFYQGQPPYRWNKSFEYFRIAIEKDPKNATNFLWRALVHMKLGYLDQAMSDLNQCLAIDPNYGNCQRHKATVHLLKGQQQDGIDLYLRTLETGVPGRQLPLVYVFALNGNRSAALLLADKDTYHTGAPIKEWIDLIENPAADRARARAAFDRWLVREHVDINMVWPMAVTFGAQNRLNHDSYAGFVQSMWLPAFRDYRRSPHFKETVRGFNMLPYWQSNGFPPQCRPVGDDDLDCD